MSSEVIKIFADGEQKDLDLLIPLMQRGRLTSRLLHVYHICNRLELRKLYSLYLIKYEVDKKKKRKVYICDVWGERIDTDVMFVVVYKHKKKGEIRFTSYSVSL
ncbi:hypothetical protein N665_0833s0005 [Sinapis alba]|nr:hypothetical protein N665_0833s0005 [Sinapis alba]